MSTTWTNTEKKANQASIAYNTTKIYNDPTYSYNGKLQTVWANQIKH